MMGGWKTWASGIGMAVFGIVQIVNDKPEEGVQRIIEALAIIGLGHKIEKAK